VKTIDRKWLWTTRARGWIVSVFALCLALPALAADRDKSLDLVLTRLSQAGSKAEAAQLSEEARALFFESGSATVDMLLQRGIAAQKQGRLDLAGDFYGDVIALQPDFAEAYHRRAGLDIARGHYADALEDLNTALSLQPRHFDALTRLGQVLERLGAPDAAYKAYEDALAINPFDEAATAGARRLAPRTQGRSL